VELEALAAKYRLKLSRDGAGEVVVLGRQGRLGEHGDGRHLQLMLLPPTGRSWAVARRKGMAAGMELWQDGDFEGTLLFDPAGGSGGSGSPADGLSRRAVGRSRRPRRHERRRGHRWT
jgi:hypothetical protein